MRSLLRTLAIAEYGMFDSIEGTVKEGNRSIVLGSIWEPEHAVIVSLVDGFGPIKGPNDCGIGSSVVLALRPTTLTYSERREQFETYQRRVGARMGWLARTERRSSWPTREEAAHTLRRRISRSDASFTRMNTCNREGTRGSSDEFYEFVNLRRKDVSGNTRRFCSA